MQLLKQIRNERHSNGWLWAELLIVFVVLWHIVDWTCVTACTYYEPLGCDVTNIYYLELSPKNNRSDSCILRGQKETTTGQNTVEPTNRFRRLPEIEAVSISVNTRPYIGSNSGIRFRLDTLVRSPLRRPVTPEFSQVFRYQSADGQGHQSLMQVIENGNAILSENIRPGGHKGDRTLLEKEVVNVDDPTDVYKIVAVSTKVCYNDFWLDYSDRYMTIPLTEAQLAEINDDLYPLNTEVYLRVKPNTALGLLERLMEQSDTQFSVGNLFILKVYDYEIIREDYNRTNVNQMQTRLWMMGFLSVSILLGIVDTFWFRTQHCRGELGLRVIVGLTRMGLRHRLNKEGLLLLTLTALSAAIICYNIGYLELTGGGIEWSVIRFSIALCVTSLLMALVILIGIQFPVRQVIRMQSAEALREE